MKNSGFSEDDFRSWQKNGNFRPINMTSDITSDTLKLMKFFGFHPLQGSWTRILSGFNILLCLLITSLAIKGILVSYKSDLFFAMECLQTCSLMMHVMVKFAFAQVHKLSFGELLEQQSKFWKVERRDADVECFIRKITRVFYCGCLACCMLFMVQPLTTHTISTVCYIPDGWFWYLVMVLWYLLPHLVIICMAMDGFFCTLGTSVLVQFKLLANRFRSLKFSLIGGEVWRELKILVDYHDFLVSYCKDLNRVFGSIFILQFLVSITSAAVAVFILQQPGTWTNRSKCLMYSINVILEMCFYCIPAELITNAANDITDAVRDSQWYHHLASIRYRKCLMMVMVRAQKIVVFSGYGLVLVNLRTLLLVLKTTFSFYTYLYSMNKLSA